MQESDPLSQPNPAGEETGSEAQLKTQSTAWKRGCNNLCLPRRFYFGMAGTAQKGVSP